MVALYSYFFNICFILSSSPIPKIVSPVYPYITFSKVSCIPAPFLTYNTIMNKLKCYAIIGIIFVILTGTLSHFVYGWSHQNFILGFFFPVSESTWEHMKMCFFPMLIYSFFMKERLIKEYPCIPSALLSGILLGTFLIPAIFYTYTGIIGKNFFLLDIATFLLSVILAFVAVYKLTLSCKMDSYRLILGVLVSILFFCFLFFTYAPPSIGIFIVPSTPF